MVKVGDRVLVNAEHLGIYNEELEVTGLANPKYVSYIGNHIIVKDRHGRSQVVQDGYYKELNHINAEGDEIDFGDLIMPLKRDEDTQRLFYPVVERNEDEVTYINDAGSRIRVPVDEVERANKEDVLLYIVDLQNQIYDFRNMIVQLLELIENDIHASIKSVKG